MADSNTPNLNLTKPEVGVATDWATKWNANADKIDTAVQNVSQAAANAEADAQSGIAKANAAQNTANTGVANAKTADDKAVAAQTTANTGVANAKTADDKAVAAQNTANTGVANAKTADDKAVAAQNSANNAQNTANAAYARMPAGVIADWAGTGGAPAGWLVCNGASISRASYPDLFNAIGGTYGVADGNSFSVPDIRGLFRRAIDDGRGYDGGRGFNSVQGSQNVSHSHAANNGAAFITAGGPGAYVGSGDYLGLASGTTASGGGESRPVNIAFRAIIKY